MAKESVPGEGKELQNLPGAKKAAQKQSSEEKARVRFNRLICEIETMETEHKAQAAQADLYHQLYRQKLLPLMQQYAAEKLLLVQQFDAILAKNKFSKAQVRLYTQWVVATLEEVATHSEEARLLLHQREEQLWNMQPKRQKARMETFEKEDEENEPGEDGSTKDFFEETFENFFSAQPKPKAEKEPVNEIDDIGTLYKELAKKLHPDLEQNEGAKAEKHELMQQLTAARKQRDLYTLLRIRATLQPGNDELGNWPLQQLKRYNKLLQEKLQTLMNKFSGSLISQMLTGGAPADAEKEINSEVRQIKKVLRNIREDRAMISRREHLEQLINAMKE